MLNGIVQQETDSELVLKSGDDPDRTIRKDQIVQNYVRTVEYARHEIPAHQTGNSGRSQLPGHTENRSDEVTSILPHQDAMGEIFLLPTLTDPCTSECSRFFGFATIALFLVLIITKRLSVITALVLVPLVMGLLAGFSPKELGEMILAGIKQVAPTGILLMFAVLYFATMLDARSVRPRRVGHHPLRKGRPAESDYGYGPADHGCPPGRGWDRYVHDCAVGVSAHLSAAQHQQTNPARHRGRSAWGRYTSFRGRVRQRGPSRL